MADDYKSDVMPNDGKDTQATDRQVTARKNNKDKKWLLYGQKFHGIIHHGREASVNWGKGIFVIIG